MERSAWTDERLDDLAATLDTNVKLLHAEVRGLRTEMREEIGGLRTEMREELGGLRGEMGGLRQEMHNGFRELRETVAAGQRQIAQIGWALAVTLIGAIVALIVAAL